MCELSATTTRVVEFPVLESLEILVMGLDPRLYDPAVQLCRSSRWPGLGRRCMQGFSHRFGKVSLLPRGEAQGGRIF